jgi:trans-aconitate methyltransferase
VGREQGPDFYDGRLGDFLRPLEESPWLPLYAKAATLLPPVETGPRVLDLGCGTGRMAKLLSNLGYTNYHGIDFSPARIAEAKRYVPGASFETADILHPSTLSRFAEYNAFIVLEVLEHIEADRTLIEALPSGGTVILSVPSYDSAAHVRWFPTISDALARYEPFLTIEQVHRIPMRDKFIALMQGSRPSPTA